MTDLREIEHIIEKCEGIRDLLLEYPDWKAKTEVGCRKSVDKLIKAGWVEEELSKDYQGRLRKWVRFKKIPKEWR